MSTARVVALDAYRHESWEAFIERTATKLSTHVAAGDTASWELATMIVEAYAEAIAHHDMQGKTPRQVHQQVNMDLRQWWEEHKNQGPAPSRLSDAARLKDIWPDVFHADMKNLPYEHYRSLATCSLPRDHKDSLRQWAETERPLQSVLRQRIRDEVDALNGVYRPDFDLKVSNHWVFQVEQRGDWFDGGVNPALFANLIHSFTDPGQTVLDPFAGGGLLAHVLKRYRHFSQVTQADHSGPRHALMSDIHPRRPEILYADAREGLPFPEHSAHFAILDPPYWNMSEGKYAGLGETVEDWLDGLKAVLSNTAECLIEDGIVAIMTDDFVRKECHVPAGLEILKLLQQEGWNPITTIYNFNRNFTGMSPQEMARIKKSRLLVSGMKLIQVARVPIREG